MYCFWLFSHYNGQVNCYRAHTACKAKNIYHLALDREGLLTSGVELELESGTKSSKLVFLHQAINLEDVACVIWKGQSTGSLPSTGM